MKQDPQKENLNSKCKSVKSRFGVPVLYPVRPQAHEWLRRRQKDVVSLVKAPELCFPVLVVDW